MLLYRDVEVIPSQESIQFLSSPILCSAAPNVFSGNLFQYWCRNMNSQPTSADELTGPITQSLQFSEANTLFSCKYIRSDLQGAWVETPSHFLISPESPNTQPWKSSTESSSTELRSSVNTDLVMRKSMENCNMNNPAQGMKGGESRVCCPYRQSAEGQCSVNG